MTWCVFCGKQRTCWTCRDKARKAAAELDAFIRQEVYPFLASTIEARSVEMGLFKDAKDVSYPLVLSGDIGQSGADAPFKSVTFGHWHTPKRRPFGWL